MKKLDKLIIKAFLGPFVASFFILLFIFVLQFFWLYIDDIVGKSIDGWVIAKLIFFLTPTLVPFVLPLALLIASIMTYGSLGESFQLVAIKSAGISLFRIMAPLVVFSLAMGAINFYFANTVIPIANIKLNRTKYDIIVSKPSFDIQAGVFYDKIEGYVLKVGSKSKDGATIYDILIYEKSINLQTNTILAQYGTMKFSSNKHFLELTLYNGTRYEEKMRSYDSSYQLVRMNFSEYKKLLDLRSLQFSATEDSTARLEGKKMSVGELKHAIDSIKRKLITFGEDRMVGNFGYQQPFLKYKDSLSAFQKPWAGRVAMDSDFRPNQPSVFATLSIPDSMQKPIAAGVVSKTSTWMQYSQNIATEKASQQKDLIRLENEWHKKFSFSFACIIMFLVGAPLGSIIRKGGIGMPLIVAIVFFVVFQLFNTTGEKMSKEAKLPPYIGMWLSSMVLFPIASYLIYKASRDAAIFSVETYEQLLFKILRFTKRFRKKP